jgi:hypothetical protein
VPNNLTNGHQLLINNELRRMMNGKTKSLLEMKYGFLNVSKEKSRLDLPQDSADVKIKVKTILVHLRFHLVMPELFPVKWILHHNKTHLVEKSSSWSCNTPFILQTFLDNGG